MPPYAFVRRLSLIVALLGAAVACSTDPYPIGTGRQPPWQPASVDTRPTADPYPIGTLRQPLWPPRTAAEPRFVAGSSAPYSTGTSQRSQRQGGTADPPLGAGAQRFAFCYAKPLNDEAEVLALAEERCGGGQLVVEDRDAFWNGCGLLQPIRVTYVCDPVAALPRSE